jgi:transcriptional regulator with XRE-family HTH domain
MPPAKKTATRRAVKKKAPAKRKRETRSKKAAETPKGAYLTAARQGMRDSLMVARLAQGWTWEEVAAEAGVSKTTAMRAVKARREAMPITLSMDPALIIERAFEGFQLSIADFERLAAAATEKEWLAVAVGAKKGANEAREKVLALLQATGRLPHDLGALRHLIDLRALAARMLDAVADFQQEVAAGADPEDAAVRLRQTFNSLIGLEEERELPAPRAA